MASLFRFLTLIFLFSVPMLMQAETLHLRFRILDDADNVLKGAEINLYEGNTLDTVFTTRDAVVALQVNYDVYYTLEIKLAGFVTKRIIIDTRNVSTDKKERYAFNVGMQPTKSYDHLENPDYVLDYPIAILQYDSLKRDFDYNEAYKKSSLEHFRSLRREEVTF